MPATFRQRGGLDEDTETVGETWADDCAIKDQSLADNKLES